MGSIGLYYFTRREIHRFMKVLSQTIFPPIISALLYIAIFQFVLGKDSSAGIGDYLTFLIPGLVMMSVINNAYANSSSSLFISKFMHHFEHLLTMPLSYFELALGYVFGSFVRGVITGAGIIIATAFFVPFGIHSWLWLLFNMATASFIFGSFGVLIALRGETFDQLGMFSTFFLTPLTMLGGVFYSISVLPPLFRTLSMFNPIFYLVDGFRYSMIGIYDAPLWLGALINGSLSIGLFTLTVYLMKRGWRVKE